MAGWLDNGVPDTLILALTALIILWYTLETARLRREAESRAANERRPRIYFEVESTTSGAVVPLPAIVSAPGAGAHKRWPRHMRFIIQNFTPNPARALVKTRLRSGESTGELVEPSPYSGQTVWDITPFYRLRGVFDVMEVLQNATADERLWLDTAATLSVQVDLYWPDGRHIESFAKEYHFKLVLIGEAVSEEFWPEVRPSVLGVSEHPHRLPENLGATPVEEA